MRTERVAYDDPDTAQEMAADASACRSEAHLARTLDALAVARHTVATVPGAILHAPRAVTRTVGRTALSVTDSAARFASRLFD